jgi:tRNA dimethylallyltransferase
MAIARLQPLEIVVADSRQAYRGMDVGTAKPSTADRAAVPHHLVDVADPDHAFTLADWLDGARAVIPQIAARGRLPLVVGGTGLYISALVDGYQLPEQGSGTLEIRERLLEELDAGGLPALVVRLWRVDPESARRVDLQNPRRVVRALERAAAGTANVPAPQPYPGRVAMLGISRPREVLRRRIDERARTMFAGGLLAEVRTLLAVGHGSELPPMTGHGYREATHVVAGEWPVERAVEVTVRHTRQYAKRQLTWFRRDTRIVWLEAGDGPADDPSLVARAVDLLRRLLAG